MKFSAKDSSEDEDEFDVGEAIGDILEGAFGIFKDAVKTVRKAVNEIVCRSLNFFSTQVTRVNFGN